MDPAEPAGARSIKRNDAIVFGWEDAPDEDDQDADEPEGDGA